jgi:signal transduction histidine kinase
MIVERVLGRSKKLIEATSLPCDGTRCLSEPCDYPGEIFVDKRISCWRKTACRRGHPFAFGAVTGFTATILIVDDEIGNRKLLDMLLQREGYLTLCAANGEQALASVGQCLPDLILLDVMMPGMDGYQVAAILKADPATLNIPIIMVTAQIDRKARLAGLRAGVEDFLTKPFDQVELWLRVRNLLRLKQALQASKDSMHQLVAHQDQIREEERKRIAREIHDELGQNLLALRIDASMLHARTSHGHRRLHQRMGIALNNIDTAIKSVRSIIADLRPFELELGLQAAVTWQLNRFERQSGVDCRLSIDETTFSCALGDGQTLAIFRILQEALSNIARHAQATRAEVALRCDARTFSMVVKDNGVGLEPDDRRKANSFGIVGINERVSSLGGELVIDSNGGEGTVLSIFIPVDKQA